MILGPEAGYGFQESTCNPNIPSHFAPETGNEKYWKHKNLQCLQFSCLTPTPFVYFSWSQKTKVLICFSLRRGAGGRTGAYCQDPLGCTLLLFSQALSPRLLCPHCQAWCSAHSWIATQFCRICGRMNKWMSRWMICASLAAARIQSTRRGTYFKEEDIFFPLRPFCSARRGQYGILPHTLQRKNKIR